MYAPPSTKLPVQSATDICVDWLPYSNGADMRRIFVALSIALSWGGGAHALDKEQQQARALLKEFCARCHAIGRTGQSPHPYAPPFRELGENKLYDEGFSQRLQDGLSTIHPDMPTFRFSQRDAGAVIEYLRAIQSRSRR
jgi:mono/diheme cytochrome c family protein